MPGGSDSVSYTSWGTCGPENGDFVIYPSGVAAATTTAAGAAASTVNTYKPNTKGTDTSISKKATPTTAPASGGDNGSSNTVAIATSVPLGVTAIVVAIILALWPAKVKRCIEAVCCCCCGCS